MLLGFVLTMAWDRYKFNRDSGAKEKALLTALRHDFLSNIEILEQNRVLLAQDLTVVDDGKSVVLPLTELKGEMWDLVKHNLPKILTDDIETLVLVRDCSTHVDRMNATIRSRQDYRTHNKAMTSYSSEMRIYDTALLEQGVELLAQLNETHGRILS